MASGSPPTGRTGSKNHPVKMRGQKLIEDLTDRIKALESENETLSIRLADSEALKGKYDQMKQDLQNLAMNNDAAVKQAIALEKRKWDSGKQELLDKIADLSISLENEKQTRLDLEKDTAPLKDEINGLRETLANKTTEVSALEEQLQQKEADHLEQVEHLQKDNTKLSKQISSLEYSLEEATVREGNLQGSVNELSEKNRHLTERAASLEVGLEETKKTVANLQASVERLQLDLDEARSVIAQKDNELAQLSKEKAELDEVLEARANEILSLRNEMEEATSKLVTVESELAGLKIAATETESLKANLAAAQEQLVSKEEEYLEAKKKADDLGSSVSSLQAELQRAKGALSAIEFVTPPPLSEFYDVEGVVVNDLSQQNLEMKSRGLPVMMSVKTDDEFNREYTKVDWLATSVFMVPKAPGYADICKVMFSIGFNTIENIPFFKERLHKSSLELADRHGRYMDKFRWMDQMKSIVNEQLRFWANAMKFTYESGNADLIKRMNEDFLPPFLNKK